MLNKPASVDRKGEATPHINEAWLHFFREVRRLAAVLDEKEQLQKSGETAQGMLE